MNKHTYYTEADMKSKKDGKLHAWTAKVGTKGQIVIPQELTNYPQFLWRKFFLPLLE